MKQYLILLLIVILTIVSCKSTAPPTAQVNTNYTMADPHKFPLREVPTYIQSDFTQEEKASIVDAINTWNYALNGYIRFDLKSKEFNMVTSDIQDAFRNHGLIVNQVDSKTCSFMPVTAPGHALLAWADLSTRVPIYLLEDRIYPQDVYYIMLHEMGHILGANHDEQSNNLMYPHYTKEMYSCIDKETINQVAKFNNLDAEQLNYCVYEKAK